MKTTYKEHGFKNRKDYLKFLEDEYGSIVYLMAEMLDKENDFDSLVTSLESYQDFIERQ